MALKFDSIRNFKKLANVSVLIRLELNFDLAEEFRLKTLCFTKKTRIIFIRQRAFYSSIIIYKINPSKLPILLRNLVIF